MKGAWMAAAVLILAGAGARAEQSAEVQSAVAAQDFDLSGVRDAAGAVDAGKGSATRTLRSAAAGKFTALADGTKNLAVNPPPVPPAPKKPSRAKEWIGDRVESAKETAKIAAWFVPTAAGAAIGGFVGAAIAGPVGAGVGAAVGGAAGAVVTAGMLLVKLALELAKNW